MLVGLTESFFPSDSVYDFDSVAYDPVKTRLLETETESTS